MNGTQEYASVFQYSAQYESGESGLSSLPTADRLGVAISGLCLIHCLVLPFVLPVTALLAIPGEGVTHFIFAALIIPTTVWAVARGFKRHRSAATAALLLVGALIVSAVAFWGHDLPNEWLEGILTSCGSALLIVGHNRNRKTAAPVCQEECVC